MSNRINVAKWLEKYRRWQIKVRRDGERRTFTSPVPGRKGQLECQKKADDWLNRSIVSSTIRVIVLFNMWIDELKITTSKSHWIKYEQYGKNYILPIIGPRKVCTLTEQMLQEVILYAYKHPKNGVTLSQKTLKNIMYCLASFIKYARKNNLSTLHPEALYIPKGATEHEKRTLQPSDIEKLFSHDTVKDHGKIIKEWYIYAFRFAIVTGLRPGEIAGLQMRDIRGNRCTIKRAINCYGEVTAGKNDNALRSFILPKAAIHILEQQKEQLVRHSILSPFVFPSPDGGNLIYRTYYKHWKAFCLYNDILPCSLYEMRHTFFSFNKTAPQELIKLVGGHSSAFDTFGVYGHELLGEAEKAAAIIDEAFQKYIQ